MYIEGDRVLFIGGDNKDKFGTYMYHERDSGYWVPHVKLEGTDIIVKPWESDIISMNDLEANKKRLNNNLEKCEEIIEKWNSLDNEK